MASHLCCTVPPRMRSPDLPNVRALTAQQAKAVTSHLPSEQHDELQTIFESVLDTPENEATPQSAKPTSFAEPPTAPPHTSPRQSSLVGRLKKRLSKIHTRSTASLSPIKKKARTPADEHDNEGSKRDFPASLLNSGSRGGYDSDANSIQMRGCSVTPRDEFRMSPIRGRKARARPALKDTPWGLRKTSGSKKVDNLSPVRNRSPAIAHGDDAVLPEHRPSSAFDFHRPERLQWARRSRSESQLRSRDRLDRSSSQAFPAAIEYIVALQALAADMASQSPARSVDGSQTEQECFRTSNKSSTSFESAVTRIPKIPSTPREPLPAYLDQDGQGGVSEDHTLSTLSSNDASEGKGKSKSRGEHSSEVHDEINAAATSLESIHLWSMRISQHLRTTSLGTQQTSVDILPYAPKSSSSSSAGEKASTTDDTLSSQYQAPSSDVNDSALASDGVVHDAASSIYSSKQTTPTQSPVRLNARPGAGTPNSTPSSHMPCKIVPRVRLETSEGTKTITSREYSATTDSHDHHIRELPVTSPAETASLKATYLSPARHMHHDPGGQQPHVPLGRSVSWASKLDAVESSRSSRFKEEEEEAAVVSSTQAKVARRPSLFNLLRPSKSKAIVARDAVTVSARYDGSADNRRKGKLKRKASVPQPPESNGPNLRGTDEASNLFAQALMANQAEKEALILPENRDLLCVPLHAVRGRSASISLKSGSSLSTSDFRRASISRSEESAASLSKAPGFRDPQFLKPNLGEPSSGKEQSTLHLSDSFDTLQTARGLQRRESSFADPVEPEVSVARSNESKAAQSSEESTVPDLGAWARYPSHSRPSRTGSAGHSDHVFSRDFALQLLRHRPPTDEAIEAAPDGTPTPRSKKRKGYKRTSLHMSKSKSLTMSAKRVFRGYSQMFKSQSLEYMAHGHGHRTSISGGGMLKHPELEVLPPVFPNYATGKGDDRNSNEDVMELRELPRRGDSTHKESNTRSVDSVDTRLRLDGAADTDASRWAQPRSISVRIQEQHDTSTSPQKPTQHPSPNAAMLWSQLYASCVELPSSRISTGSSGSASPPISPLRRNEALLRRTASSPTSMRSESPCLRLSPRDRRLAIPLALLERNRSPSLNGIAGPDKTKSVDDSTIQSKGHARNRSIVSITSLRRSTHDLCLLLMETENKERERLLQAAEALVVNLA